MTRHLYHQGLFLVVEKAVLSAYQPLRVDALAREIGISSAHLSDIIKAETGETLASLVRRLTLERAASRLAAGRSVAETAMEAGYANPEAFARAFTRTYGQTPSRWKDLPPGMARGTRTIPGHGIHWNPSDDSVIVPIQGAPVPLILTRLAPIQADCMLHVGDYWKIAEGWQALQILLQEPVENKTWVANFRDDGMRKEDRDKMRSDLGYLSSPADPIRPGLKRITIRGGIYVVTPNWLTPQQHSEAWTWINQVWVPKSRAKPTDIPGYDLYDAWPLPWLSAKVKVHLGFDL